MRLFLAGDVMTGRGIDQALAHPCDPAIREPYVQDARDYVALAERAHGEFSRPVAPEYIWGEALEELASAAPDLRIVNLETAVTRSDARAEKGINYRASPENLACLAAARIDCCVLANNHVLDWGASGLAETLDTLRAAGFRTAGAGRTLEEAEAPAILAAAQGRLLVFSFALETSGVPASWAARPDRPGVAFLPDLSPSSVGRIAARIAAARAPGDLVVASVHWGANWDFGISAAERGFAHALVERAGVDLVHGHSSHHAKGIEVHRGRLVLYGCGDLINDYEGIGGYEEYGAGLGLLYFADLDRSGALRALRMVPTQAWRFSLRRAAAGRARWLRDMLRREGKLLGTGARLARDGALELVFDGGQGARGAGADD